MRHGDSLEGNDSLSENALKSTDVFDGNDPFRELESALSITPSPEFTARIRQRVAGQERVSWWGRFGWVSVATATAAAIVVVAIAVWPGARRDRIAPEGAIASISSPTSTSSRVSLPAFHAESAATVPALRVQSTPGVAPAHVFAAKALHTVEVMVPDDERLALNHLLLALRAGRATVPAPVTMEDADGQLLAPPPIDIPLMKEIEPLSGNSSGGSGRIDR